MSAMVLREDRGGAATLTLNRPDKLNALNVDLFKALDDHVAAIAGQTDTVGLVIVRGAGRCFSAGHDLADIATGEKLIKGIPRSPHCGERKHSEHAFGHGRSPCKRAADMGEPHTHQLLAIIHPNVSCVNSIK